MKMKQEKEYNISNSMRERAEAIAEAGSLQKAISSGIIPRLIECSLSEGLVLGLLKQGVNKYLAIFGHGSTDIGEVLRVYHEAGLIQTFNFRNEIAMAHAATTLSWQYGEIPALVTSIGPGAMQALAGSLASTSNGIGLYHIYGDETTHGEGYNMQQIPKTEQELFGRITALFGESYVLHTPQALRDALRRGGVRVNHPWKAGPFYLMLPINTQPELIRPLNLDGLPEHPDFPLTSVSDKEQLEKAADLIRKSSKMIMKTGGGSCAFAERVQKLAEICGIPVVLSPGSTGVLPDGHPLNMHVGGSKGSISGNFAMANAELLVVIGSRAVCQSDCSGIGYEKVTDVINLNGDLSDVSHYNRTIMLPGDIGATLDDLLQILEQAPIARNDEKLQWLDKCAASKKEWSDFKQERFNAAAIMDQAWGRPVLTQPAAIKVVADFAKKINAVKYFDAGDVQANGFQIVEDDSPFETFTESGASYMGFAPSALAASALADHPQYGICFSGDGSFMMNPQILIDSVELGVKGMIVIFDNRRMGAITGLQEAQYRAGFKTSDSVEVDYVSMGEAVNGVKAFYGGESTSELKAALEYAYAHQGLSVIHVPVYYGTDPLGGMGAYGSWNVGNWCEPVQEKYHSQNL
jgi:3D-(3,5/4)-trihydroxycyclohexane-1,2-dione acylhydrolase (decyclizing)